MKLHTGTFLLISLFILSCNKKLIQTNRYFEGKIEYSFLSSITDEFNTPNLQANEATRKEYGDRITEFHKEGDYLRLYNSKDTVGIQYQIFKHSENKMYTKYNFNDTLYTSLCIEDSFNKNFSIINQKIKDINYFNINCDVLETSYQREYPISEEKKAILTLKEKFYYTDRYKMDPEKWNKYKKSYVYQTFKITKSIPLYYEKIVTSNMHNWVLTEKTNALSVSEENVHQNKVIINKNLPIKEK